MASTTSGLVDQSRDSDCAFGDGPTCTEIRSSENHKKDALRALGYDPNPNGDQMVHAFSITCHRGLDGGVEAMVGDRDGRSGLVVAGGIDRVLAGKRTNVRVGRTRTAPGGVGAEDVGMDEPRR